MARRKSIEELKKNGTYRPSRHDLPAIGSEVINPRPYVDGLSDWAMDFFNGLCDDLKEEKKLAPEDLYLITDAAILAEIIHDCRQNIKKHGYTVEGSTGNEVESPHYKIMLSSMKELHALSHKLGMGPMPRMKLALNRKELAKTVEAQKPKVDLD